MHAAGARVKTGNNSINPSYIVAFPSPPRLSLQMGGTARNTHKYALSHRFTPLHAP